MLFEVISGQIRLGEVDEFYKLHHDILLPAMAAVGIKPFLFLITEVGRFRRFIDIYQYDNMVDYEEKTNALISKDLREYYSRIQNCINGDLLIELMNKMPYSP